MCRQGRVPGPGIARRAPGGRTLSQEDLESFGLSIEVSSEFAPPAQPQQQQFAGKMSPAAAAAAQFTSKPPPGLAQFSPAPGHAPSQQFPAPASSPIFIPASGYSPAPGPQQQQQQQQQQQPPSSQRNSPFSSQFSPPNTINSKQPFQF